MLNHLKILKKKIKKFIRQNQKRRNLKNLFIIKKLTKAILNTFLNINHQKKKIQNLPRNSRNIIIPTNNTNKPLTNNINKKKIKIKKYMFDQVSNRPHKKTISNPQLRKNQNKNTVMNRRKNSTLIS